MDHLQLLVSRESLRAALTSWLLSAATQGTDGLFIAVSYYLLMDELQPDLRQVVTQALTSWSPAGEVPAGHKEELLVHVQSVGLDSYPRAHIIPIAPDGRFWSFVHPFRKAKPAGFGMEAVDSVYRPWDPQEWDWRQVPACEVLAEGLLGRRGHKVRILGTPYPFFYYHIMITFLSRHLQDQYNDAGWHDFMATTAADSGIDGLWLLANPIGGHASKPARHTHCVVLPSGSIWPFENADFRSRSPAFGQAYPAHYFESRNRSRAFEVIKRHLLANEPVSCAYSSDGRCVVFPRRFQKTYELLSYKEDTPTGPEERVFSSGVAIMELLGCLVTDAVSALRIRHPDMDGQLRIVSLPVRNAK